MRGEMGVGRVRGEMGGGWGGEGEMGEDGDGREKWGRIGRGG